MMEIRIGDKVVIGRGNDEAVRGIVSDIEDGRVWIRPMMKNGKPTRTGSKMFPVSVDDIYEINGIKKFFATDINDVSKL